MRKNKLVEKIVNYVNHQIADDPSKHQQLSFRMIALELGCTENEVHDALGGDGGSGCFLVINSEQREALELYRSTS
ncbi:hypothetical protein [Stappia indica]|uniref:hypothetical protein n=1 Tax=Stappia indica TaxID=538381 RepID=UPI001CD2B8F2|nr:hypothetical protein [Stappia indica]MCA1298499.1 hypothetical protein [Stappia indica]